MNAGSISATKRFGPLFAREIKKRRSQQLRQVTWVALAPRRGHCPKPSPPEIDPPGSISLPLADRLRSRENQRQDPLFVARRQS